MRRCSPGHFFVSFLLYACSIDVFVFLTSLDPYPWSLQMNRDETVTVIYILPKANPYITNPLGLCKMQFPESIAVHVVEVSINSISFSFFRIEAPLSIFYPLFLPLSWQILCAFHVETLVEWVVGGKYGWKGMFPRVGDCWAVEGVTE